MAKFRFLAVCIALVTGGPRAYAQEFPERVRVGLHIVSEGGATIAGATLEVALMGEPSEASVSGIETVSTGDTVFLDLRPGLEYRVRVAAPGHRTRTADFVPSEGATFRMVLALDPYSLPPIVASADHGDAFEARSVYQTRFAEESLTYATVGEWLRDVPGVSMRGRGPGGAQVLSVRGSRPEDVLVLLDGAPLNDPLTGRADLSMIPTSTLEMGTLVQGASSQRYGSGAGAGVLLLTSRAGHGTGLSGGIRVASFGGAGVDVQADASNGDRRLGVSLSAARAENDFPFRNPVATEEIAELRTNADAESLHGAVHAASGPIFGSIRFDNTERGVPGRAGTSLFDEARARDLSWTAAAGISLPAFQGSASYGRHRLEYRAASSDPYSRQEVRDLRMAGEVRVPSTPVTLGARVTRELVEGDAIEGSPGRTVVGGRLAAALATGRFLIDPALSVDATEGGAVASPEIGITWTPDAKAQLWARAGQGFRLPAFGDLYFASQYQLRPNPDLEAERITLDSELGVRFRTAAGGIRLEATVSGWARRTENPIIWLSSSAALWSPRNVGELRARGLDAAVELGARDAGKSGWRAQFAGTWQSSRVGFGTNRNSLPYEPSTSGRISIEGWVGSAGARADVRHTGARTTSLAATRLLPGFTTMDLSARYHFDVGSLLVTAFSRLENVLDREYTLIELYPEPGRQFTFRLEATRDIR